MKWSDYTHQLDAVHAPDALVQRLHAMEEDADPLDAPRLAKPRRKLSALHFSKVKTWQVAAALACCVGITALVQDAVGFPYASGMGSNNASGQESTYDMAMPADDFQPEAGMADGADSMNDSPLIRSAAQRKVIYTADLLLESTDYDQTRAALDQALTDTNGYVQQTSEYTRPSDSRNLHVTYRIPAENYTRFLDLAAQAGNLIRTNETSDDVTTQYIDTKARVDALISQRDRLVELQKKAENLEDLLTIEEQLTQAQYELESWQTKLNFLADQTDYCTVNLDLNEVQVYTPTQTTPLDRLANTFRQGFTTFGETLLNLLLRIVLLWPWLLAFSIVLIVLRWKRKKHPKN